MNLLLRARHRVPIYGCHLALYVAHDAQKTFNRVAPMWGIEPERNGFRGMATHDGEGTFGLFFNREDLTESTIAHEAKHCGDDMMDYVGQRHCPKCSNEARAYLHGYLQEWVKRQLKRAGLKVK